MLIRCCRFKGWNSHSGIRVLFCANSGAKISLFSSSFVLEACSDGMNSPLLSRSLFDSTYPTYLRKKQRNRFRLQPLERSARTHSCQILKNGGGAINEVVV